MSNSKVFKVVVRKSNASLLTGSRKFEIIAPTATRAIEKAATKFKAVEDWKGPVTVLEVLYRGRAV